MFDSYLQIDGLPGEATDSKHKDWIQLLAFDHSMEQPTSSTRSSAGGATSGRAKHGDFGVSKFVDKSSPKLYEALSTGKHFSKIKIEVCRAGAGQVKFMEINMEEVLISNVQMDSTGLNRISLNGANANADDVLPTERVTFNYGRIEWIYTQQKRSDGTGGGNVNAKFDLTTNK